MLRYGSRSSSCSPTKYKVDAQPSPVIAFPVAFIEAAFTGVRGTNAPKALVDVEFVDCVHAWAKREQSPHAVTYQEFRTCGRPCILAALTNST